MTLVMNSNISYQIHLPQFQGRQVSHRELADLAKKREIRPDTSVLPSGGQISYRASDVPGVFSNKEFLVVMLLSFTVGVFGVDRFYLGYKVLGTLKLLTFFVINGVRVYFFLDIASDSGPFLDAVGPGYIALSFSVFLSFVWWLIDMVLILSRKLPDAQGLPLK